MQRTKILLGVIITLIIAFVGFKIFQQDVIADYIRPFILPILTLYYCIGAHDKRSKFFFFLMFYSIGELLQVFYYYAELSNLVADLLYFGCNILYILAYLFLTLYVLQYLNLKRIFGKFMVHIIILAILDVYCVVLVTEIAIKSGALISIYDYILEFVYNAVIMLLLTITLINYLDRDTKKAMALLLGALCIVFSEVIQVAYFYVSEIQFLNIAYILLMIVAFVFFYRQARMLNENIVTFKEPINEVEAEA